MEKVSTVDSQQYQICCRINVRKANIKGKNTRPIKRKNSIPNKERSSKGYFPGTHKTFKLVFSMSHTNMKTDRPDGQAH